jgi:hypothetical protein
MSFLMCAAVVARCLEGAGFVPSDAAMKTENQEWHEKSLRFLQIRSLGVEQDEYTVRQL